MTISDRVPTPAELEEAIAYYKRSLAARPDDDIMWMLYGNALCAAERWEEAVAAYEHAAAQKQVLPEVWYHLGVARMGAGDFHKAVEAFEKHLERSRDVEVLVLASLCLDVEDERARSRAFFEQAMRKDGPRAMAYLKEYAGELLEAAGPDMGADEAHKGLQQALGHIDEYLVERKKGSKLEKGGRRPLSPKG